MTEDGQRAFVSILRADSADQVYAFNAQTYEQTATKEVGKGPHLFHVSRGNKLFVPCQNTNQVLTLNGTDLSTIKDTPLDGAHGIFSSYDPKFVVVTGINVSKLYTLKGSTSSLVGDPTATSVPTPHNVVVNLKRTKVFVTHSGGSANQVSVFRLNRRGSLV